MYCLITESAAPPQVIMQNDLLQNTGLRKNDVKCSANSLRISLAVTVFRLFTNAEGATLGGIETKRWI